MNSTAEHLAECRRELRNYSIWKTYTLVRSVVSREAVFLYFVKLKKRNERQTWSFSFLSTQKGQNSYGVLDTMIGLGGHWEEGPATCSHLTSPAFVAGGSSVHSDWQECTLSNVTALQKGQCLDSADCSSLPLQLLAPRGPAHGGPWSSPFWSRRTCELPSHTLALYPSPVSPSVLGSWTAHTGHPGHFWSILRGYGWETTPIPPFFSFFFPNKYLAALYCLLLSKNEKLSSLNRMFKKFNV